MLVSYNLLSLWAHLSMFIVQYVALYNTLTHSLQSTTHTISFLNILTLIHLCKLSLLHPSISSLIFFPFCYAWASIRLTFFFLLFCSPSFWHGQTICISNLLLSLKLLRISHLLLASERHRYINVHIINKSIIQSLNGVIQKCAI